VHAAKGYYDGADAFISYHPHFANTAIWETQCGSYWSVVFTFETTTPEKWIDKSLIPTTHTSHAAARCPGRSTRCPGAIDALCLMYTTTKVAAGRGGRSTTLVGEGQVRTRLPGGGR
jgi:aminobenzoyl-glutamate utilization protein B